MKDLGKSSIPRDSFIKSLPPVTEELKQQVRLSMNSYLWYQNKGRHSRTYTCSHCGKTFTVDDYPQSTDTGYWEEYERKHMLEAKIGESFECKCCGKRGIVKSANRGKKGCEQTIRADLIIPVSHDEVVIRGIEVYISYENDLHPELYFYEDEAVTILTPQNVYQYIMGYGGYNLRSSICENFPEKNNCCMGFETRIKHFVFGDKSLKDTFLKYNLLELCNTDDVVKLLAYQTRYPIIEKLYKAGYESIVGGLIYQYRKGERQFDWNKDTIKEFFKYLSKPEYSTLRADRYCYFDTVQKSILLAKTHDIEFVSSLSDCNMSEAIRAVRCADSIGYRYTDVQKYFNKRKGLKSNTIITWLDYISNAKKLEYDLTVYTVAFPKNLTEAHDKAEKSVEYEENKALMEKYQKRYKRLLQMYHYENNGYAIVIPDSQSDIIREGKLMQHCVGGYAERHMTGATTILFLRSTKQIDKPLYTIEIDDKTKKVRQIQGFNNRTPLTPEAKRFYEEWQKDILGRCKAKPHKLSELKAGAA